MQDVYNIVILDYILNTAAKISPMLTHILKFFY